MDEACTKAGWVVHAWCVMSNHYHLCLQTPRPNLVEGMRWLQSTFAIRFNRLRDERGHLFQGRYKALPVAADAVGAVCHYIHLNPVRAGLSLVTELPEWRWTSIAALFRPGERPAWLSLSEALADAGGLVDTPAGRRNYLRYLGWLQEDDAAKKALAFEQMTSGWALGTRAFKKELLKEHGELVRRRRAADDQRRTAEALWRDHLATYLAAVGKGPEAVRAAPKGAAWKVAVAAGMKGRTTASNPWLARELHMGSPFRLSRLVTAFRTRPAVFEPYASKIAKCKV